MAKSPRSRAWLLFAGGLLLGQMFGPAVAWAADKVDINWPNVFKIEAYRNLPVEVERPVEVKIDRYSLPQFNVKIDEMPPLKVENAAGFTAQSLAPSFAPLRETAEATTFVMGTPGGTCYVLRLDNATGQVSRVSTFEL